MPLSRGSKGDRQLGESAQSTIVASSGGAPGMGEEHGISVAAALADHHRQP